MAPTDPTNPPTPAGVSPDAGASASQVHEVLRRLSRGATLTEPEAEDVFERVLTGAFDPAQIGALLSLMATRPPTPDELVGGARAMRRHVTPVERPASMDGVPLIDTCGTGGAPKTFNVSTVSAIVTAASAPGRVLVAKHGSRSRTGRGSAEVMEALGVSTDAAPRVQRRCLERCGVCFSYAVNHHPAMKHAAGPRKSLGFPTIFNLLGPLTNPAGADRQLLGAYDRDLGARMGETLARLGAVHAMVVTSHDGLDEFSTTNTNLVHEVRGGVVTKRVIDPVALGLPRATLEQLTVHTLDEAAALVRTILEGQPGPARDMTLLSASASLVIADVVASLEEGLSLARGAIDSGRARETLRLLVATSNEPA